MIFFLNFTPNSRLYGRGKKIFNGCGVDPMVVEYPIVFVDPKVVESFYIFVNREKLAKKIYLIFFYKLLSIS